MDILISDDQGRELGSLNMAKRVDVDIGNKNDMHIYININVFDEELHRKWNQIFIPGKEYGGIINQHKIDTEDGSLTLIGDTWRGMLGKKIISPPSGEDYLVVSGEVNSIMSSVIGSEFDGPDGYKLIVVSDEPSGFSVTNYQFNRYVDMESGFSDMLKSVGARMQIEYIQGPTNGNGYVLLRAVPIVDYSSELEMSQDNKVDFVVDDYSGGINHLICLGSGDLKDRQVAHLYVDRNGKIGQNKYYKGVDERMAIYDYKNAESIDELLKAGIVRMQEIMNYKSFKMTVSDIDADIGDIIGGRERVTGVLVKSPIKEKILRIKGNSTSISYKLEGEE